MGGLQFAICLRGFAQQTASLGDFSVRRLDVIKLRKPMRYIGL
jgi:hypothetical protein